MSTTLIAEGATVPFTVPAGGLSSGDPVLIGTSLLIAAKDYKAGEDGEGFSENAHGPIPADSTTAFANLDPLYWDDTDGKLYNAADGGTEATAPFVGLAFGAKLEAAATCSIKLIPSE